MNLRLISRRVKDSSPQVSEDIIEAQELLESQGIDFEPQDIGEPDSEYLAYLRDMLPQVQDSLGGSVKADRLSEILPRLDFSVDLNDSSNQTDDDGSQYTFKVFKDEFIKVLTASDKYKIILFGGDATLTLGVKYSNDKGDNDTPPDSELEVVSSELELDEILGIWVLEGEAPVVYIEGSMQAEDLEVLGAPEVGDFSNIVMLEDPAVTPATLKEIDEILIDHIGSAVYTADLEN